MKKWWNPEKRKLNWTELEAALPFRMREELRAKRAKALRERQPLTSEEFRELWNQTIRNEKEAK